MDAAIEQDVFLPFEKRSDDARAADFRARAERDEFQEFPEFLSLRLLFLLLLFSNCYCFIVLVIVNSLFSGEVLERHVSLSLSLCVRFL